MRLLSRLEVERSCGASWSTLYDHETVITFPNSVRDFLTGIGGTVIDHDHTKLGMALSSNTLMGLFNGGGPIFNRHNDINAIRRHGYFLSFVLTCQKFALCFHITNPGVLS